MNKNAEKFIKLYNANNTSAHSSFFYDQGKMIMYTRVRDLQDMQDFCLRFYLPIPE